MGIIVKEENGKKTYVDEATGRAEEYEGRTLLRVFKDESFAGTVKKNASPQRQFISPNAKIKQSIPEPMQIGRNIVDYLPAIGATAGSFASPVLGTMAGGLTGTALANSFKNLSPEFFGQPISPLEGLLTAGIDAAANFALGGGLLTKAGTLKAGMLKIFGKAQAISGFLRANPDFPVTTGQATGNPVANIFESVFPYSSVKSGRIRETQQGLLEQKFKDLYPTQLSGPAEIATVVKDSVNSGLQEVQRMEGAAYGHLRNIIAANPSNVEGMPISGAVTFTESVNLANTILTKLKNKLGTQGAESIDSAVRADLRDSITRLEPIALTQTTAKPTLVTAGGKPIPGKTTINPVDFEAAKLYRSTVGKSAFKKSAIEAGVTERELTQLYDALTTDMETSLAKLPFKGAEALDTFRIANKITTHKKQLYKETVPIRALVEETLSGIPDVKTVLRDPVAIDKALLASGSQAPTMRAALQTEFLQDIHNSSFDEATKRFSPKKALDLILDRDHNDSYRKLFSAPERNAHEQLFKAIHVFDPTVDRAGRVALGIRAGGAGLSVGAAIGELITSGSIPKSATVAGALLGIVISGDVFTSKILMNNKLVRVATGLAKLPPESQKARVLKRILFLGLKGSTVAITDPNGNIIGNGTVGENGKVIPEE